MADTSPYADGVPQRADVDARAEAEREVLAKVFTDARLAKSTHGYPPLTSHESADVVLAWLASRTPVAPDCGGRCRGACKSCAAPVVADVDAIARAIDPQAFANWSEVADARQAQITARLIATARARRVVALLRGEPRG